jgi:hypothetical protein
VRQPLLHGGRRPLALRPPDALPTSRSRERTCLDGVGS